ncbi:MAG: alkaline phosphatase [Phycisphaerae bacterium]|jgi:alkaline phosphatase
MNKYTKQFACLLIAGFFITSAAAADAPKNIIIMIGDGSGFNHIAAASIYQSGQPVSPPYTDFTLGIAMSTFPAKGSYSPQLAWASFGYVKQGYTDSAAAATAMSTGIKTKNGYLGVDPNKAPVKNITERCEQLGKSTGVVTTVPISHSTPAGFVAHNKSRNSYEQIAKQMLLESAVDCVMGACNPLYNSDGKLIAEPNDFNYVGGQSTWDLIVAGTAGADADADGTPDPWTLVQTRDEFIALADGNTPKRVLGLAQISPTLQQGRSGNVLAEPYGVPLIDSVPTLAEMSKAALNILDDDPDGFFLMIEGGAVDWASHKNQPGRMLEEQIDFNKAVEAVMNWVNAKSSWSDTLLIVTADHECGYLTGPNSGDTPDGPKWNEITNLGQGKMPGLEFNSHDHTNSLVPFYSKGQGVVLFKNAESNLDPIRGPYIDNTIIAKTIFALLD